MLPQSCWSFDSDVISLNPFLLCLINQYCNSHHKNCNKYNCGKSSASIAGSTPGLNYEHPIQCLSDLLLGWVWVVVVVFEAVQLHYYLNECVALYIILIS